MLVEYLAQQLQLAPAIYRYSQNATQPFAYLSLLYFAFKHANAHVVVTVQRLWLPAWIKCLFHGSKLVVVWHHLQPDASWFTKINSYLLIKLCHSSQANIRLVVVSDYWKNWFIKRSVSPDNLVMIPNLFNPADYPTTSIKHEKLICLGQWSEKLHEDIFILADELTGLGYEVYFTSTTLIAEQRYPVIHFTHEQYLQKLASAAYCVCLSAYAEGWNRMAHEAVLCGTTVIAYPKGGLSDLLEQSDMLVAKDVAHIIEIIQQGIHPTLNVDFIKRYDLNQISYYAGSLIGFCNNR